MASLRRNTNTRDAPSLRCVPYEAQQQGRPQREHSATYLILPARVYDGCGRAIAESPGLVLGALLRHYVEAQLVVRVAVAHPCHFRARFRARTPLVRALRLGAPLGAVSAPA